MVVIKLCQEVFMTLEEMEKRLQVLEDIEAIKEMHRRYAFGLASQQWDDMLELFTDDAVADIFQWGIRNNKKEIEDLFKNTFDGRILPTHGHMVAQPVIKVDGDTAEGYWIMYLFFPPPDMRWVQGRHDCRYVKVNGEWKFKYLKFTRPWPPVPPEK
jgi:ketosteroid isomerase-like protein